MNRSGRSYASVEGGVPAAFAGALAHHAGAVPSRSTIATAPCAASSSEYPKSAPPARTRIRFGRTTTRVTALVRELADQR
jgi:hypothetical protein